LQAGDVDLIEYVPWQSMEAISKDDRLVLDAVDGPYMYLIFNATRPPFDDPGVRKAVGHAIRREEIVRAAFFGRGAGLAHLPIPKVSEFFNREYEDGWRYDPALAKQLLAEAGHPDGFGCSLLSTAQYGMHKDCAEVVQQNIAAIGIKAELKLPDWATRVTVGNKGQYDMAVMGDAADSNDPDGIAKAIDGSLSAAYTRSFGLKDDKITALIKAGSAEFDAAKGDLQGARGARDRAGADRRSGLAQPGLCDAEAPQGLQEPARRAHLLLGNDLRRRGGRVRRWSAMR
jgi:peptide/nickel transport system substrate-binding protein